MNDFPVISIKCPHCLIWSMEDANFCHKCGTNLRPSSKGTYLSTCILCREDIDIEVDIFDGGAWWHRKCWNQAIKGEK